VVGFYQCIAAVPSVYDVVPPVGLEHYTRWVNLLQRPADLETIFVPTACLGSYRTRILFGSLWPIVLLLLFAAGFITYECVLEYRARNDPARQWRGITATVEAGLYRVLPLTTGLTFVLVPSTSTRIFKTFLCDPIQYDDAVTQHFLHVDLSLNCDGDEYTETYSAAVAMLVIWPVGIPALYAILILGSRGALRKGHSTKLSRATNFLYGDYGRHAIWWEPVEMCRKLTLTGERASYKHTTSCCCGNSCLQH
jgi:hypothetical protein